jgi:hypothetical protein
VGAASRVQLEIRGTDVLRRRLVFGSSMRESRTLNEVDGLELVAREGSEAMR